MRTENGMIFKKFDNLFLCLLGDDGWFVAGSNGRCFQYKKTEREQTWTSSRQICQAEGGDLAHRGIRDSTVIR